MRNNEAIDLSGFYREFQRCNKEFHPGRQVDCGEVLMYLLNDLHDSIQQVEEHPIVSSNH